MNEPTPLKMGIYQHYKGPLYQVLGLAHDANDEGRTCVVYFALDLNPEHLGPRLAVRTLQDFTARVNETQARFAYMGPELQAWMLESK